MEPRLILACGCDVPYRDGETPVCGHGPQRVVRTVHMPKPRIRGVATGPCVQTMDLAPSVSRFAGSEAQEPPNG